MRFGSFSTLRLLHPPWLQDKVAVNCWTNKTVIAAFFNMLWMGKTLDKLQERTINSGIYSFH